MKKLINLTPHAVTIVNGGESITIDPSGIVARCKQTDEQTGYIETEHGEIPISETKFGEVIDLPDPKQDTCYIVSRLIMQACSERNDLLVPNEIIRDDKGNIIGCASLANN